MAKKTYKKVRCESQCNVVIVVSIYGWRGDRRLAPRTIRGFFRVGGEDALWDIQNGGHGLDVLSDRVFKDFKHPKGQQWSVSESWSRIPKRN